MPHLINIFGKHGERDVKTGTGTQITVQSKEQTLVEWHKNLKCMQKSHCWEAGVNAEAILQVAAAYTMLTQLLTH